MSVPGAIATGSNTSIPWVKVNRRFIHWSRRNKELAREILALYDRHGWQLRRVLLRSDTIKSLDEESKALFANATIVEADFAALWFARRSHEQREAWELRLISEQPYALFVAFEADEIEEQREEARQEMEARMREHTSGHS